MRLGDDDAFAARRVVDAHQRAAREQHRIDLFGAPARAVSRFGSVGRRVRATAASSATAAGAVVLRLHLFVGTALGRRLEIHGNHRGFAHQHDFAAHLIFGRREPCIHFVLRRTQPRRSASAIAATSRPSRVCGRRQQDPAAARSRIADAFTVPLVEGVHASTSNFSFP